MALRPTRIWVFACNNSLADAVLGDDGDLFVLGAGTLVRYLALGSSGDCKIITRSEALGYEDLGAGMYSDDGVIVLALLSGCGYLPALKGNGQGPIDALAREYMDGDGATRGRFLKRM